MPDHTETISELRARKHRANADLLAAWEDRGDRIAVAMGYEGLDGLEAVHRYLVDKHHWLPRDVRGLTTDDFEMLFAGDPVGKQRPRNSRESR